MLILFACIPVLIPVTRVKNWPCLQRFLFHCWVENMVYICDFKTGLRK